MPITDSEKRCISWGVWLPWVALQMKQALHFPPRPGSEATLPSLLPLAGHLSASVPFSLPCVPHHPALKPAWPAPGPLPAFLLFSKVTADCLLWKQMTVGPHSPWVWWALQGEGCGGHPPTVPPPSSARSPVRPCKWRFSPHSGFTAPWGRPSCTHRPLCGPSAQTLVPASSCAASPQGQGLCHSCICPLAHSANTSRVPSCAWHLVVCWGYSCHQNQVGLAYMELCSLLGKTDIYQMSPWIHI